MPFRLFGFDHITALIIYVELVVLLLRTLKSFDDSSFRRFRIWLAVIILIDATYGQIFHLFQNTFDVSKHLPLNLCGINRFLIAFYLLKPKQWFFNILYYWIMCGASLALIFPDIKLGFPSLEFFEFFISHGLPLFGICFLVFVQQIEPDRKSYLTSFVVLNIYAFLFVYPMNLITEGNYLYLLDVPQIDFGPIQWLPPWPWYLIVFAFFFLVLFRMLYQPYHLKIKGEEKIRNEPQLGG